MKIGLRLGLSFGVIIVLLVVLVISAISSLSGLNSEVNNMAHDKFPKTVWANGIIDAINEGARSLRNAALTKDIGERDKQIERALATTPPVVMYLDSLKRTVKSEEGIAILNKLNNFRNGYIDGRAKIIEFLKSGNIDAAVELMFGEYRK